MHQKEKMGFIKYNRPWVGSFATNCFAKIANFQIPSNITMYVFSIKTNEEEVNIKPGVWGKNDGYNWFGGGGGGVVI